jgi:hypothetical protein
VLALRPRLSWRARHTSPAQPGHIGPDMWPAHIRAPAAITSRGCFAPSRRSASLILSLFHLMAGSTIPDVRSDPEKAMLKLQACPSADLVGLG